MSAQHLPKLFVPEEEQQSAVIPYEHAGRAASIDESYFQNNTVKSFHLELFRRSVVEQQIYSEIVRFLGDVEGKVCMDLGSHNGVISHYLRQRGGDWYSADLGQVAVGSIRSLVRKQVFQTDGMTLPFSDGCFDAIVIVDMLGQVSDTMQFCSELARVIKPGGRLVVNVQNSSALVKPEFFVRGREDAVSRFSRADLEQLLNKNFLPEQTRTYSRIFSAMSSVFTELQSTDDNIYRLCTAAKVSSVTYPLRSLVSMGDMLCPFLPGEYRIFSATRR